MPARLARKVSKHFDEEIRFFKNWIDQPKAVGAILPTSACTARKMASLINVDSGNPVLELGPGTGVITQAILDKGMPARDLYSVEFSQGFLPKLRQSYPDVQFLHGDAFNLDSVLPDMQGRKFDAIVSGIPLLNFPTESRIRLLNDLLDRLNPGRPVVQFSYGPKSPIPPNWSTYSVEPLDWMVRNVPPARLWVYRRVAMM
ncbi:MAG: phospholipid N-methyltransferase PmtA [Rhizobiaceae bacterium]